MREYKKSVAFNFGFGGLRFSSKFTHSLCLFSLARSTGRLLEKSRDSIRTIEIWESRLRISMRLW